MKSGQRTWTIARIARAVGVIGLVSTMPLRAQSSARDLPRYARQIIKSAQYAAFITVDSTGQPQARTIQPIAPDSQWVVWFATNPHTRKVAQIRRDPRVTLYYFDAATLSYVSMLGRATLITDRASKNAHWHSEWSAFYADRDTSVVLVRVVAERLEVVSTKLGITGDAATWKPPTFAVPSRR